VGTSGTKHLFDPSMLTLAPTLPEGAARLNDGADLMDPEHDALLVKTLELIATTRGEIAHLRAADRAHPQHGQSVVQTFVAHPTINVAVS
jgi:hypothetical protein